MSEVPMYHRTKPTPWIEKGALAAKGSVGSKEGEGRGEGAAVGLVLFFITLKPRVE